MILLLMALLAAGHVVVGQGDTVESLSEELGEPGLASTIRALNGLEDDEQPAVGDVLDLPPPTTPSDQASVVDRVRGAGTIRYANGQTTGLQAGSLLPPGSQVCTGDDGYATLRLAVGCTGGAHDEISLVPGTCLTVDATLENADTRSSLVSVERGSVIVQEQPGTKGTVTVRTRSGLTSGQGGGFRVHVEEDLDSMRTEALSNPVSVLGGGEELALDAGQGVRTPTGEAPGEPVELLLPGSPIRPEDQATLRLPEFAWTPVDDAAFYRMEIALDEGFRDVSVAQVQSEDEWSPQALLLPTYAPGIYWRVTPVDRMGFQGQPSPAHYASFPGGVQ